MTQKQIKFEVKNAFFEVVGTFDTWAEAYAYAREWEIKTGRRFAIDGPPSPAGN